MGVKVAAVIGKVTEANNSGLIKVRTSQMDKYQTCQVESLKITEPESETKSTTSCCCPTDAQPEAQEPPESPPVSEPVLKKIPPSGEDAFQQYMAAIMAPGAINLKNKKLMALALSIITKCEPCVKINIRAAADAGASKQEIAETVALAIAFGGAPVNMFYNSIRTRI